MNNEKKQQAKNLFFQTDLNKTQIAATLGISRRSLTYWIKEGNWNRLKGAATNLPSVVAESCYHIIGHLTERYLSAPRLDSCISPKEIDALHKLSVTVNKLKNRSSVNERVELFTFFLDELKEKNPTLAAQAIPYVEEYLLSRTDVFATAGNKQAVSGHNKVWINEPVPPAIAAPANSQCAHLGKPGAENGQKQMPKNSISH